MGLGEAQRLRDPENEPSEAKPRQSTELKKLLARPAFEGQGLGDRAGPRGTKRSAASAISMAMPNLLISLLSNPRKKRTFSGRAWSSPVGDSLAHPGWGQGADGRVSRPPGVRLAQFAGAPSPIVVFPVTIRLRWLKYRRVKNI
jgi:hypothetical protein